MVEGDGKGARDLRTRVTERDRRVSLVGLATNRVFNGEPFAFNPLSPCDLILLQPQDRRNPVHYIYIHLHSLHLSSYRVARTIDGCRYRIEFLEFNAFGRIHLLPSLDSSIFFDMKREWTVESGGEGTGNWRDWKDCSANANENGEEEEEEEEEVLVDSWCTAVPMETLGGHSYFNLSLLLLLLRRSSQIQFVHAVIPSYYT